MVSKVEVIQDPIEWRRHVVLLGAGASSAALPDGDKVGRKPPLLNDLAQVVGPHWDEVLRRFPVGAAVGFEAQFAELRRQGTADLELSIVEDRLAEYFGEMELPELPTIYDYLILGLRPKDVIATFNWDPYLMQAHLRCRSVTRALPDIRFLHGAVNFATCSDHDVLGIPFDECPKCNRRLRSVRLIMPDDKKDYASNAGIDLQWSKTELALRDSFLLTIFGYSGPRTDEEARRRLFKSWSETKLWDVSHLEIIDIAPDEVLLENWREFIPYDHSIVRQDFWSSSVAEYPRRTDKWKMEASLYGRACASIGPYRAASLSELHGWFRDLIEVEERAASGTSTPGASTP